jgi:hypothetical protein
MEFVQLLLSCLILICAVAMFIGSMVMTGLCWYHGIVGTMVVCSIIFVALAIKEYKQSKQ